MGIPVKGVLVSTFLISGLCAGIGAIVLAGRTAASSPLYGNLLELDTIAAVIIGGASFLGGRGHIGHALVGALMIGVIRNALNLNNVDVFFQMIAIGADHRDCRRGGRAPQPAGGARADHPGGEDAMSASATAPVLAVRHAQKRFGAVHALKSVSLEAHRGEVLALLGDNGAGKSTLVKCISGVHALDEGEILLDGEPVAIRSPGAARRAGIETVYQDLALFDNLTPAQNFYCGREIAVSRMAAAGASLPEQPRHGPRGGRRHRPAEGEAAEIRRAGRAHVGRPAAGDRGGARDGLRAQGGDPRRAHRGAWSARVAQGPRPDRAASRGRATR